MVKGLSSAPSALCVTSIGSTAWCTRDCHFIVYFDLVCDPPRLPYSVSNIVATYPITKCGGGAPV